MENRYYWKDDLDQLKENFQKLEELFNTNHLSKEFRQILENSKDLLSNLREQLWGAPIGRFAKGYTVSEQEYYLLLAIGIDICTMKKIGLAEFSEYEVLELLHYEDERIIGYINPNETPWKEFIEEDGTRKIISNFSIGVPPEDIHISALSNAQKEFFQKYLPKVYSRFRE